MFFAVTESVEFNSVCSCSHASAVSCCHSCLNESQLFTTSSSCSSFAAFGSFFESSNASPFRCSAKLEANSCFENHYVKILAPFDYCFSDMVAMAISFILYLDFSFAVTVASLICLHQHNY